MRGGFILLWVLGAFLQCSFSAKTDDVPELALLAVTRPLVSNTFTYSGSSLTWSDGLCGQADQSTGVGPYAFPVDSYVDSVLITVTSNIVITNPVCDGQNESEFSLYVDGVKRQTLHYDRCWGQMFPMTGAFVIPLGLGIHTMELKFCANSVAVPTRIPQIQGNYPTVLSATSLASSRNYLAHATSVLSTGTTTLPNTFGAQLPISSLTANVAPAEAAVLWQNLSLGGMAYQALMNYRLNAATGEIWWLNDDGPVPGSISTLTQVPAGSNAVATLQESNGTSTIVGRSTYDNSLNVVAFKVPEAGTYGKAVITGTVIESAGVQTTLMSVPVTRTAPSRYLISFAGNDVYSPGAGHGCDFFLYVNGAVRAGVPYTSSNGGQKSGASLISVETVPAGSAVPVEIRYVKNQASNCIVDTATLEVLPLE